MKKLLNLLPYAHRVLILYVVLFPLIISCKNVNTEYTRCEEMCEYSRRDCIQVCGGYNNFGFSIDFGESGFETPYACTDKCEKNSERCLERCGERSKPHE
jgi:hypothetical protein